MNISQAFYNLLSQLQTQYDEREATAIAHMVMEHLTGGMSKTERILNKNQEFTAEQTTQYQSILNELCNGTPVQYVLKEAWFMGMPYFVDPNVLIPRPETEELVDWILTDLRKTPANKSNIAILDIGTGSGCIAIALKKALPAAEITACDISSGAIGVAKKNAIRHQAEVNFVVNNFLDEKQWSQLGKFDIIVCNPPYIPTSKKETMNRNVTDFEPANALFVPDDDPFVFYKAIARFGLQCLNPSGSIYCELESSLADDCFSVFDEAGYPNIDLKRDMNYNLRMVKAWR